MGLPQKQVSYEAYTALENRAKFLNKKKWFLKTGYIPHKEQWKVHRSNARLITVVAGRQSGKTTLAAKEAETTLITPDTMTWIVAPTYDLTDKIFSIVWKSILVKNKGAGIIKASEYNKTIKLGFFINEKGSYELTSDTRKATVFSEIIGKSADNPISLLGENVDLIVFDECAQSKKGVWEKYLRPTLTKRQGRAIFITTPEGTNWVHKLFMRGKSNEHPEWESFHFTTYANPELSKKDIEEAKSTLPSELFRQMYLAEFVAFLGKVYSELDITTHCITPDQYPDFIRVIIGIDHGFINETAIIVLAEDYDSRWYLIDEHYEKRMYKEDVVGVVKKIKRKYKGIYGGGYADTNDPERNEALRNAGLGIYAAKKDDGSVRRGIQEVSKLMKIQEDGKPRLFIAAHCKNSWEHIPNYKYKETNLNNVHEIPLKKDDHLADALRYAVYTNKVGHKTIMVRKVKGLYG